MNLYIDIGNSRIKWKHDTMHHSMAADSVEALAAQWRKIAGQGIGQVLGCCVRGKQLRTQVEQLVQQRFGVVIRWQRAVKRACGVSNAYPRPADLGADRWVALIAARARFPQCACIVVDAGTAITIDLLDASGRHRGGVIMPGARLMLDSLNHAEQLFPGDGERFLMPDCLHKALADNTHDALVGGVVHAVRGGVRGVIEQQALEINAKIETLDIILTGGGAGMLKLDSMKLTTVPDLVLEGLDKLAHRSK